MSKAAVQLAGPGEHFLSAMALVDDLRAYARDGRMTALLAATWPELVLTLQKRAEARAAAGEWLRLFHEPLTALDEYRSAYLKDAPADPKELEQGYQAAVAASEALRRRIARL